MNEKILARGKAASPGIAVGLVKVITKLADLNKLEDGDILVTMRTNPAWIEGMIKASALVTEVGGVISHAAIVSREMGLPCVVAVNKVTSILKDGQRIKVDGTEGVIYEH